MIRKLAYFCIGAIMASGAAGAQETINLIVPFSAGGPTDQITRLIGNELAKLTGKTFIVENKPGAAGIIAAQYVARAKPDGTVYMIGSPASLVINKGLYKNLPYDPEKDFVPVSGLTRSPLILIVNTKVPADNVKELVAFAKSSGQELRMASPGSGTIPHLAGSYFANEAGIKILHVPFKGIPPALMSVMAGQTDIIFDTLSTSIENVKAGKIKAVGIASDHRFSVLPNTPTLDEQGYNLEASSWFGLMAPAKTPKNIVDGMNQDINKVLTSPEFKQKLLDMGSEALLGNANEFAAFITKERQRWLPEVSRLKLSAD